MYVAPDAFPLFVVLFHLKPFDSKSISQGTFGNFIPQLGGLAIGAAAAFGGTSALGQINSAANSLAGISRNARSLQGSVESIRQRFI